MARRVASFEILRWQTIISLNQWAGHADNAFSLPSSSAVEDATESARFLPEIELVRLAAGVAEGRRAGGGADPVLFATMAFHFLTSVAAASFVTVWQGSIR